MATFYLRGNYWYARLRLWDAGAGKWVWKDRATHCRNQGRALAVADEMERASHLAASGGMTRARAGELVDVVLTLAGLPLVDVAPMTWEFAQDMVGRGQLAYKTGQKYQGNLDRFKAWAGKDRRLDAWTLRDFTAYYATLVADLSPITAYGHLRFWRSVFNKAMRLGLLKLNPAHGVETAFSVVEEKASITRQDQAALLRGLRRQGADPAWPVLALLGWHTGHRIQDLLGATAAQLSRDGRHYLLSLQPGKKERQGGRTVVLPLPRFVWLRLTRLVDLKALNGGKNANGRVSNDFVAWLKRCGVDPLPSHKKARLVHLKSFHSYRHGMASRLAAAGVSGEIARLVTDHASATVHRGYVHAEIESLAVALRKARRV